MKLSIISHYYNNRESVESVIDSFEEMARLYPGAFDFILVDDHSHEPIDPALFERVENLRVFRIIEDVAWNMPAARNIGVRQALCDKIVLMDIDHTFDPAETASLLADARALQMGQVANFRRMRVINGAPQEIRFHVNSFMIHKADYERVGGYEELFSGNYGHEDKFFKVCCRRNDIKEIQFNTFLYVHGAATPSLDRDRSVNTVILDRLLAAGVSNPQKAMAYHWEQIYPR